MDQWQTTRFVPRFPVRNCADHNQTLATAGGLSIVLATEPGAIAAAQRLRQQVFFQSEGQGAARDQDGYDKVCQHLLMLDHDMPCARSGEPQPVAACRLLHQDDAIRTGFYSQQEFEIAGLLAANRQLKAMEVGRVCIQGGYRGRRAVDLLWRAIWVMARRRHVGMLFGCASLPGTDVAAWARHLEHLRKTALAPAEWGVVAHPERAVAMAGNLGASGPDRALGALPPLLKTYLRLGARVGDGAVIDPVFGTIDVFVALRMADVGPRYAGHLNGADPFSSSAHSSRTSLSVSSLA